MEKVNCTSSPTGEHQYDPSKYSRDDMAFYLDCVHCGKTNMFDCDTVDDLYYIFYGNED